MSDEKDPAAVLRKSLDAVDGIRRRMLLAGYLTVAGTFGAFFWLDHVARTRDVKSVITAAVLALTCIIAWSTFALALFMMRMTRRVLRAIDLAAGR
jgi:uncharacterized membrane protein (GlpM family)